MSNRVPLPTFGERLRWAREAAKLTQPDLAILCGWDSQSRISHYETGRREPSTDDLRLIATALKGRGVEVAPGWLQFGDENDNPPALVNVEPGPASTQVPLISWISAGEFAEVMDPLPPGQADEWFPFPARKGRNLVCLRVRGDSMTASYGKSYPDGSIIFVDLDQRSPANGARVVAKLDSDQEATFKVYIEDAGRRWLKPLNPQHPPILSAFHVVGTVVGKLELD
jgi:SOS-response transcriptional repressor LexA